MGKKRNDALYNRMRNGKEDLEKYYKERERFCNDTTCKGLDLLELEDQEYMKDAINKINSETLDRINREDFEANRIRTRAGLGMVSDFQGSSILTDDKKKYMDKSLYWLKISSIFLCISFCWSLTCSFIKVGDVFLVASIIWFGLAVVSTGVHMWHERKIKKLDNVK